MFYLLFNTDILTLICFSLSKGLFKRLNALSRTSENDSSVLGIIICSPCPFLHFMSVEPQCFMIKRICIQFVSATTLWKQGCSLLDFKPKQLFDQESDMFLRQLFLLKQLFLPLFPQRASSCLLCICSY